MNPTLNFTENKSLVQSHRKNFSAVCAFGKYCATQSGGEFSFSFWSNDDYNENPNYSRYVKNAKVIDDAFTAAITHFTNKQTYQNKLAANEALRVERTARRTVDITTRDHGIHMDVFAAGVKIARIHEIHCYGAKVRLSANPYLPPLVKAVEDGDTETSAYFTKRWKEVADDVEKKDLYLRDLDETLRYVKHQLIYAGYIVNEDSRKKKAVVKTFFEGIREATDSVKVFDLGGGLEYKGEITGAELNAFCEKHAELKWDTAYNFQSMRAYQVPEFNDDDVFHLIAWSKTQTEVFITKFVYSETNIEKEGIHHFFARVVALRSKEKVLKNLFSRVSVKS